MGAQGKGLQVQNHNGRWIDAMAQPDELMINVGDMLSRHTQQQVEVNDSPSGKSTKRIVGFFSLFNPFLYAPVSDMSLNCLPECIDENNQNYMKNITAGEFLHERLVELGLIKEIKNKIPPNKIPNSKVTLGFWFCLKIENTYTPY